MCTFVGALLELLVVVGLLHQLQDVHGELGISEGEGLGVHFVGHFSFCGAREVSAV